LSKPASRNFEIAPKSWFLVPKITAGLVVGDVAEKMSEYKLDGADKLFYGAAADLDYCVWPRMALGVGIEFAWKGVPAKTDDPINLKSYQVHAIYRFRPLSKATVYLRPEVGWISLTQSRGVIDSDYGTYMYVRAGLGQWLYTGSSTVLRIELYYKHAFTGDAKYSSVTDVEAAGVGIETGLGFGF
jgi:hypothetical protein